jgi:hypothetical protein
MTAFGFETFSVKAQPKANSRRVVVAFAMLFHELECLPQQMPKVWPQNPNKCQTWTILSKQARNKPVALVEAAEIFGFVFVPYGTCHALLNQCKTIVAVCST